MPVGVGRIAKANAGVGFGRAIGSALIRGGGFRPPGFAAQQEAAGVDGVGQFGFDGQRIAGDAAGQ